MTNVLLLYPKFPNAYWNLEDVVGFAGKKAPMPPLGLMTLAAMLPESYDLKLVDLNVGQLKDSQLRWADYVFISAMDVQKQSAQELILRANGFGKPVVFGGPASESTYREIKGVDAFFFGKAEPGEGGSLERLLHGIESGHPHKAYGDFLIRENRPGTHEQEIDLEALTARQEFFKDAGDFEVVDARQPMSLLPVPRFDLANLKRDYASANAQATEGCPYVCDFCNQGAFEGNVHRTKEGSQVVAELEAVYRTGYRGSLFFVDNNFSANKPKLEKMLPAIIQFQQEHKYPFSLFTEASTELSARPDLLDLMRRAGFQALFLGIESPDANVLDGMGKSQNMRDLVGAVRTFQKYGMEPYAGFIYGTDKDPQDIAEQISNFIRATGIPQAMIGLLNAMPGSELYLRFAEENRLLHASAGNNTSTALNFIPLQGKDPEAIQQGYRDLLGKSYEAANYFERCDTFLDNLGSRIKTQSGMSPLRGLSALAKSLFLQGVVAPYRKDYLQFIGHVAMHHPGRMGTAVNLAVKYIHFNGVTNEILKADHPYAAPATAIPLNTPSVSPNRTCD